MTAASPFWPRCEVCDSRLNSHAVAICAKCRLLPTASVTQLDDHRTTERTGA